MEGAKLSLFANVAYGWLRCIHAIPARGREEKTRNHALADWPRGSQAMHVFSPQISLSWNALNRLHLMQQSAFNPQSALFSFHPSRCTPEITVV